MGISRTQMPGSNFVSELRMFRRSSANLNLRPIPSSKKARIIHLNYGVLNLQLSDKYIFLKR